MFWKLSLNKVNLFWKINLNFEGPTLCIKGEVWALCFWFQIVWTLEFKRLLDENYAVIKDTGIGGRHTLCRNQCGTLVPRL